MARLRATDDADDVTFDDVKRQVAIWAARYVTIGARPAGRFTTERHPDAHLIPDVDDIARDPDAVLDLVARISPDALAFGLDRATRIGPDAFHAAALAYVQRYQPEFEMRP